MIRRLKKNVLKELPDKIRTVVPLILPNYNEYHHIETNFADWLKHKAPDKAEKALKAEALVKLGYLKRTAATFKLNLVINWINDFLEENDEKLVLFCSHTSIIEALLAQYKNISVRVDGSVTGKERHAAVAHFQTNKKIRLFIGNIRAAGEGITLTAASNLAFVELDFTPSKHIQAEDRIHRIGQKETVNIFYLIAKDTIEEDLCKMIQKKNKIIAAVIDGTDKPKDFNVFNRLTRKITKRHL
jgi:SNF2 family DNA or RNA helicase